MPSTRAPSHVVLLGIGHTHAHVLRMWRGHAPPGARLTCVSEHPTAVYSAMLPGVLAGQYPPERMAIDLARLCAASKAALVVDEACEIDVAARAIRFATRPPLEFDVLSVGIGSVPSLDEVSLVDPSRLLAVKPMQTFLARLAEHLQSAAVARGEAPIRLAVVGGGAGSVEVALCLPHFVAAVLPPRPRVDLTLVSAATRVPGDGMPATARRVQRALDRQGVRCLLGQRVVEIASGRLRLDERSVLDADVIVWMTDAAAPPLLAATGLPTDPRGFLRTTDALQSISGAPVFAVGDAGTIEGTPAPKAGVYAVRQGPVLWENIQRLVAGATLVPFQPQVGFLRLLNTGDGRAIGEWKSLSFEGRWCWWLKDAIDRRFIDRYQL